jgi:response regulator RpfG family c-di-GMP phosphodiesterase
MTSTSDTQSDLPTMLVVDDELRSRESLSRVLNPEFEVFLADSALEARKLLEQHPVSVILCDQRMHRDDTVGSARFFLNCSHKVCPSLSHSLRAEGKNSSL